MFDFFRRWQNLYILLISVILTLISFIKPETKIYKLFGKKPNFLLSYILRWIFDIPLAIALIFFAIKEMYLDFIKWKKDKLINNQTSWVYSPLIFEYFYKNQQRKQILESFKPTRQTGSGEMERFRYWFNSLS